jgi:hypothetical protein
MTHDELLIEINRRLDVALYNGDAQSIHALRAVVELHKPSQENYTGEIGCVGCDVNSEYGTWQEEYPCPTIQAIEKELQ